MSFAWYIYTLALMLVAAVSCAVNVSLWAVTSRRQPLFAAIAFGCYLFELAGVFYSEYVGDKLYMSTYIESGLHWPVFEILVSTVLFTALWGWSRRRAHVSRSPKALGVFAVVFGVVSVLVAPLPGRAGVAFNVLYWSWRDMACALAFGFPLVYARTRANENDRVDIERSGRFFILVLLGVACMLAWDTLLVVFFDAESFSGMARDFWWHATERNIPENLVMVLCAACSLADARNQALAFLAHPADRVDDSDRARLDRRIAERLPRFADKYELSKREREVMALFLQDKPTNLIAEELYISPGTVKAHLHRIYQKVGVQNREDLALTFWRF